MTLSHLVTWYGVAAISRLLKMIGLFCRISPLSQGSFAKETYHIHTKEDPSEGCFVWVVSALLCQKRIFPRTNKADQKHCENWRYESGSEFHKTSPMCERGEWRQRLRAVLSLKVWNKPPLAPVQFQDFFGRIGREWCKIVSYIWHDWGTVLQRRLPISHI